MNRRPLIALDFDGVLSKDPNGRWLLEEMDFSLIRQAHERGYAVAVMTCNDVRWVARELRRQKIRCRADVNMVHWVWDDARTVLVTNRKMSARAYVDDKALNWHYGDDPELVWDELDRRESARCLAA